MKQRHFNKAVRWARSRRSEALFDQVVRLRAGDLWLRDAQPCEIGIVCERGSVWVTQEHDSRDFVLQAGQSFRNGTRGRVAVQALTSALVRVTRQLLRRVWRPVWVALAMASATPAIYEAGVIGLVLAGVLGLFARYVSEELTR